MTTRGRKPLPSVIGTPNIDEALVRADMADADALQGVTAATERDTQALAKQLGYEGPLAPDLMPIAGDKLAPALTMAQQLLERTASTGGHVIVLSDGFTDPIPAAAAAERHDARRSGRRHCPSRCR